MGWKASAIIINKPAQVDHETLLKELGYHTLEKIEDECFDDVMNPDDDKVYIGQYKDNLLICAPDIPMHFFEDSETETERILNRIFPQSEICSILLHSAVNLWGYSVTKNGQKIRARAGSSEDGTYIDSGEPLEEEKELLGKSQLDQNGKRIYFFDHSPDKPYSEDQLGENFVFSICKRYFDEELDCDDELLYETTLTGYTFDRIQKQQKPNVQENQKTTDTKPWWKFW